MTTRMPQALQSPQSPNDTPNLLLLVPFTVSSIFSHPATNPAGVCDPVRALQEFAAAYEQLVHVPHDHR
jgi:hypothetical protein